MLAFRWNNRSRGYAATALSSLQGRCTVVRKPEISTALLHGLRPRPALRGAALVAFRPFSVSTEPESVAPPSGGSGGQRLPEDFSPPLPSTSALLSSSLEDILATWPVPALREQINDCIRAIAIDEKYAAKAKTNFIDSVLWSRILIAFRRVLQKEPMYVFDTEPWFRRFVELTRASLDDSSVIPALKEELFKGFLSMALKDYAEDIQLYKSVVSASDLRVPHEWYPRARIMKRRFIYHGGPTNSGKTYQALKRLREADPEKGGGLYCGPLRLLALEIYESLNRQGIYCDLFTGQEKRDVPNSTHVSCTIEMVSITRPFDVVVVDEIQMIANPQRGHSWTRAIQGLQANEIHICGGMEASEKVRQLVLEMGDDFELVNYNRLSPLVVAEESLRGDYGKVQKGDCIVAFSKADLFSIKAEIERRTPHKCCLVYGQLPPETRSTQARLFNDENSGFDVLVASDAIGMGLNLNIRRVIFHTTLKMGSDKRRESRWLLPTFVKQIGGRAGRLSSNYKFGEVTSWQETDLAYIRAAMKLDIPQLDYTGIFPSVEQLEEFSEIVKKANNGKPIDQLSKLMSRFVEAAQLDSKFRLSEHSDMILVSNWLQTIPMSLRDRFTFANAPVNTRDPMMMNIVYHYAAHYALKRPVALNVRLPKDPPKDVLQLTDICLKHNIIDLYIWLALRFPDLFVERDAAIALKAIAINMIESGLESEKLHHKFNHSEEYRVTREKEMKSNPDLLPPAEWGQVREETRKELAAIDPKYMFVFPKDRGVGTSFRLPSFIRNTETPSENRSMRNRQEDNKNDSIVNNPRLNRNATHRSQDFAKGDRISDRAKSIDLASELKNRSFTNVTVEKDRRAANQHRLKSKKGDSGGAKADPGETRNVTSIETKISDLALHLDDEANLGSTSTVESSSASRIQTVNDDLQNSFSLQLQSNVA